MRFFTTEGPAQPEDHYGFAPLERWNLDEITTMIAQKKYFLLHTPRQSSKTTYLLALMAYLNQEGRYRAVYTNIESAQAVREDVVLGMTNVVQAIANSAAAELQIGELRLHDWHAALRETRGGSWRASGTAREVESEQRAAIDFAAGRVSMRSSATH